MHTRCYVIIRVTDINRLKPTENEVYPRTRNEICSRYTEKTRVNKTAIIQLDWRQQGASHATLPPHSEATHDAAASHGRPDKTRASITADNEQKQADMAKQTNNGAAPKGTWRQASPSKTAPTLQSAVGSLVRKIKKLGQRNVLYTSMSDQENRSCVVLPVISFLLVRRI